MNFPKRLLFSAGVETFSDVPIRFSKAIRQRLLQFPKASKKGIPGILGLLKGLGFPSGLIINADTFLKATISQRIEGSSS